MSSCATRLAAAALLTLGPGCIWLTEKADPDGDGVPSVVDCAPSDPEFATFGTWYTDLDGDGFGDDLAPVEACVAPERTASSAGDCDDLSSQVYPGAPETCDGADEDCDGVDDDVDLDEDGFSGCEEDCDDQDEAIHAGAADACGDGLDAGCDGAPCLASLADSDVVLYGEESSNVGSALLLLTDMDGDGLRDLGVGADADDAGGVDAGALYLLRGPLPSGENRLSDVAWARLLGGVSDDGERGDHIGRSAVGNGDLDGDGQDDLAVGGHQMSAGRTNQGGAYVVFGPIAEGDLDLATEADQRWLGEKANDRAGYSLAVLDLDHDDEADLVVGAYTYDRSSTDEGAAYMLYDPLSGGEDLSEVTDLIYGEATEDQLANRMTVLGDLDGDGRADLGVACVQQDAGGSNAGTIYLLTEPVYGAVLASDAASAMLVGPVAESLAGSALSTAGDLDADGVHEIWIGGMDYTGPDGYTGAIWLVDPPLSSTVTSLSDARQTFIGQTGDNLGWDAAGGLDLSGDGILDMVAGAKQNEEGGTDAGMVWLVPGPFEGGVVSIAEVGARFTGANVNAFAGRPMAMASGLGEDDRPAFLSGAAGASVSGVTSGAIYVVFGFSL